MPFVFANEKQTLLDDDHKVSSSNNAAKLMGAQVKLEVPINCIIL